MECHMEAPPPPSAVQADHAPRSRRSRDMAGRMDTHRRPQLRFVGSLGKRHVRRARQPGTCDPAILPLRWTSPRLCDPARTVPHDPLQSTLGDGRDLLRVHPAAHKPAASACGNFAHRTAETPAQANLEATRAMPAAARRKRNLFPTVQHGEGLTPRKT